MEIFTWQTDKFTLAEEPRVLTAQFGDGYRQDSPDGLNADLQALELTFEDIYAVDALAMRAFLKARGAAEAFLFVTLLGETIKVKCAKWDVKPAKKNRLTITCTFKQVP